MSDHVGSASLVSSALKQEELFPIREVARLTGVNPVTLRAWERRYGLIQPTRTDSGHRLYSQVDIESVRSILAQQPSTAGFKLVRKRRDHNYCERCHAHEGLLLAAAAAEG